MELVKFKNFEAVNEASMGRVYQHTQGTNVGIISAHRGDVGPDVNKANHAALGHEIRKAGFGFIHVKGAYTEKGPNGEDRPVHEKSYMVIGKKGDDSGHLKGFLKSQGQKFNQDSILHKSHDSEEAHLHGTNSTGYPGHGNSESVGKFHPNRAPEFHSVMRGNRGKFAFGQEGEPNRAPVKEGAEWRLEVNELRFYSPKGFFAREEVEF